MKSITIHAWTIHKVENKYFLPYTHWIYLNEISKLYYRICLISPIKGYDGSVENGMLEISNFRNVEVYELPYSHGYIDALKYFRSYFKAYRRLKYFDSSYVRYPIPFGWLQKLFFKNKDRIIHFVGDPIDVTKANPNFNWLKRLILISFFLPEHLMYIWACRGARVFTNGYHLSERLSAYNLKATPIISSTLNEDDFYFNEKKEIDDVSPKIIYVGYLRKAKGVEIIIRAFILLQIKYPKAQLSIVGSGEFENELKEIVRKGEVSNVTFLGHVDDRNYLNHLLRIHDIFCFASLSEGSPRVILEAMANGINVVSTPVGSLPYVFEDRKEILFAKFKNEEDFCEKIEELIKSSDTALEIRSNAFVKVKEFTIKYFLKKIFYEN